MLPAGITEGQWTVKVTTQYSSSSYHTKEPRTFELQRPIYIGVAPEGGGSEGGNSGGGGGLDENPLG